MSIDNNNSSTSARSIDCHYRNKYEKWYWLLIRSFENRELLPDIFEQHHPIPKELWPNGWKSKDTIWTVGVTFREHFILHLLLVKSGNFSSTSLKRFLDAFGRGKNKVSKATNLKSLWKSFMLKHFIPHNKGKVALPYVTEEYRYNVGKGGRGRSNNPGLKCKPWLNNKATTETLGLWKIADYLSFHYQLIPKKNNSSGSHRLAEAVGVEPSQTLYNIVRAFNGKLKSLCPDNKKWVPEEDEDWKAFSML